MNALQIMSPNREKIDWDSIQSNDLIFPPLFKVFHNTYDIKTILDLHWYYYKGQFGLDDFGKYTHPLVPGLLLDTIFDVDKIVEVIPKVMDLECEPDRIVHENKIIPIAYGPIGDLLMLGIGEKNSDRIYYFVRHLDEYLREISENIFEFFKDYHIEISEHYQSTVPFDRLYRNWGEDFWRVRE